MRAAAPRLPGIRFEDVLPPAPPGLPRMDVAAFAGFAASGPVGVPVAVDDVLRFAEIFGGDLPLAWDAGRGELAHAHLAPAVREFFRNGGRRCWVLRLAQGPDTARFRVPGLLRGRAGTIGGAAALEASSPGSWAEDLSAGATLLRKSLPAGQVTRVVDAVRVARAATADLLRLDFPGSRTAAFFGAPPQRPAADLTPAERESLLLRPVADSWWFRAALPGAFPSAPVASLHALEVDGDREIAPIELRVSDDVVEVVLSDAEAEGVRPGTWLRAEIPAAMSIPFASSTYLLVDDVRRGEEGATAFVREAWRALEAAAAWGSTDGEPFFASLVSVELWARRTTESLLRVADVALAPGHARWLGHFPPDAVLFASAEEVTQPAYAALWTQLSRPRFPFAAPASTSDTSDGTGGDVFLPLGVPALPRDDFWQPAEVAGASALERDGLAVFGEDLFLDPELKGFAAERLLDEAFYRRFQAPDPAPPTRLHALLSVEEASIVAVPDAVHAGWKLREGSEHAPPAALPAPSITFVDGPDDEGWIDVAWTAVDGARSYRLEDSPDPRFRRDVRSSPSTPSDETDTRILRPAACPERLYLRVRAAGESGPGAWSETVLLDLPPDRFRACDRPALAAPVPAQPVEEDGRLLLEWTGVGDAFRLEVSPEPTFSLARVLYEGDRRDYAVWTPAGPAFFRVAARAADEESPWSATVGREPPPGPRWETTADAEADPATLLAVHLAALRICAARSDALAVLSVPRWYREEPALAHAAELTTRLGGGLAEPGDAAARTLSFGALYHPWTVVRAAAAGAETRAIPPDGAVCGVMAARSNELGAWAAPANRALEGVAALEPKLSDEARGAFFGRKVNALAPFPAGFMAWSEETLSDDPELVGIGVRRLLILLRRLALREGNTYVFQPGDQAFRRTIRRQWDRLLGDLFTRGAFAGDTREQGFRVVADDTVNPRQSVDLGRLIVELRVAPSRPLHFLTVRLVQTGAGLSVER